MWLHAGVLERAGLRAASSNACHSRSSGLRTESILAPLGDLGGMPGGRPFGMPTDRPAGGSGDNEICEGGGVGAGGSVLTCFRPRACFVRMGEGAFLCEVQSTVHTLPLLILTLI